MGEDEKKNCALFSPDELPCCVQHTVAASVQCMVEISVPLVNTFKKYTVNKTNLFTVVCC